MIKNFNSHKFVNPFNFSCFIDNVLMVLYMYVGSMPNRSMALKTNISEVFITFFYG